MPKPVTIGTRQYTTQKAAIEAIQQILHRHGLLKPITGPDHDFLMDLLAMHPNAAKKIGAGVKHFAVEKSTGGTSCFYIHHLDGSPRVDFSYFKCLKIK